MPAQIVEAAAVPRLFEAPRHPYTEALLAALPERNAGRRRLARSPDVVPGAHDRPAGCLLSPRCAYVQARCRAERAGAVRCSADAEVRCFFPLPTRADDRGGAMRTLSAPGVDSEVVRRRRPRGRSA